ncbi:MAG: S49 family peptidase, partial [Pseudomonadota bacterium]
MSIPSMIRRIFSALWNGLTRLRMALGNILFLLMLGLVYFVYVGGAQTPLPEKAALLLNMTGSVVEQKGPVDPLSAVLVTPDPARHEILLRDVVESIEHAADDPQITALVMELDSLVYVGISKSQEIVQALEKFRATGKPVIATGDYYTQDQYLLASHADEVIVHPLGGVALEGFSSYRNYFREALEKLSVKMHVFRAGDFKSAVEPYLRDDMSPQEKEVTLHWLQQIWAQYTSIVETQRDLEAGSVDRYINSLSETMIA